MAETNDFDPGEWRGHDFGAARREYDAHVGRSYRDAVSAKTVAENLVPDSISTESTNPIIIVTDVTGSMGEWPATIFSKLPYLEIEARDEYLGKDVVISFMAVGDANVDSYPLQVRPFTSGLDLKDQLTSLIIEKGGGGHICETYELGALYCVHNVHTPNADTPIVIFIADEMPYDFIASEHALNHAKVKLDSRISTAAVWSELMRKYSVYLILKPYGRGTDVNTLSGFDHTIYEGWKKILGEDRISFLPDPGRVVDVIFGILAKESGRIDYFRKEIEGRQRPDQIDAVYKSLKTVLAIPAGGKTSGVHTGRSVMLVEDEGEETKPLIR